VRPISHSHNVTARDWRTGNAMPPRWGIASFPPIRVCEVLTSTAASEPPYRRQAGWPDNVFLDTPTDFGPNILGCSAVPVPPRLFTISGREGHGCDRRH
jgi:hypothetical protein